MGKMMMGSKIGRLCAAVAVASCLAGAAQAADMSVRVYNRSYDDVVSIHVKPTYRTSYGRQDLLGDVILPVNYNVLIDFDTRDAEGQCMLDVKAIGSNGEWTRRMNVCNVVNWNLYGID